MMEQERLLQEQRIPPLKRLVRPYQDDPLLPALPQSPHGALHGIGFIYDEDLDDRVLVAIDQLRDHPGLVALAGHEGGLTTYARLPLGLNSGRHLTPDSVQKRKGFRGSVSLMTRPEGRG